MTIDDLAEYGMEQMDDDAIRAFLRTQGTGVLGLPDEAEPYLLPISFGFDGETNVYFTFVGGERSRKRELSDSSETASFLVYRADTAFTWQSVRLTGQIERIPDDEVESVQDALENAWRPDLFERAGRDAGTNIYRFTIEEQTGIKQSGIPPEFDS